MTAQRNGVLHVDAEAVQARCSEPAGAARAATKRPTAQPGPALEPGPRAGRPAQLAASRALGRHLPSVPGLPLSQALGRELRAEAEARWADRPTRQRERVRAASQRSRSGLRLLWDLLQIALLTLVVFVSARSLAQTFRVNGESMEPTFDDGQSLLINRLAYFHVDGTPLESWLPVTYQGSVAFLFDGPRRGDVVVFQAVNERNRDYLKRIVALPGDTVLIDRGILYVNGVQVPEPYLSDATADYTYPPEGRPVVVPDGSYFVLGDNRRESFDSHAGWFVPVENLVGSVWLTYWPPASWQAGPGSSGLDARPEARLE